MTLDEAIEHAEWCTRESQGECSEEHKQLAEWLRELKRLRSQFKWLRKEHTALMETRKREFAKSCEAATNNMGQIGTLRDRNAELRKLIVSLWYVTQSERDALRAYRVDPDEGVYLRALDETISQFRAEMQELRIEVGE